MEKQKIINILKFLMINIKYNVVLMVYLELKMENS
jgi:hypothetical protein